LESFVSEDETIDGPFVSALASEFEGLFRTLLYYSGPEFYRDVGLEAFLFAFPESTYKKEH